MKKLLLAVGAAAGFILATTLLLRPKPDNIMWSRNKNGKEVENLLGAAAAPWLEKAEIVSWSPDLNYQPQRYLLVTAMTLEDFKAWANALQLNVSHEVNVPPGVWIPVGGVKPSRWAETLAPGAPFLEGSAMTAKATVWSRWSEGSTYTVVQRIFPP